MKLTPQAVETILMDVLYKPEEIVNGETPTDAIITEGVMSKFGFHPVRLAAHQKEIEELLHELPKEFQEKTGGGWSFLNACMDKNGEQWGEHRDIDNLVCLGIAIGKAHIQLPRDMWNLFPGGMPYFIVKE